MQHFDEGNFLLQLLMIILATFLFIISRKFHNSEIHCRINSLCVLYSVIFPLKYVDS